MDDRNSRLDVAERRLEDALTRLETVLASARGRPDSEHDEADTASPAVESAGLSEALAEVRRQNDELKALSRDAASRLDRAIAQIDLLLED
jgi:hypothetical protein